MLLRQEKNKPSQRRPIPTPRKSERQMVHDYENNTILPPKDFRDGYKPVPLPRTKKPIPLPRTKIEQTESSERLYKVL